MLISETWSLSDELRIPSNMLSSMQTVFISDTLMEQEGVMLLASNSTHFCCLASTELSSAIWDSPGHLDVASRCNTGPVEQCWLQKLVGGGWLWCLDMAQKTLHAYVWQTTQGLTVLYVTEFLRFMKFKARSVVASCNIEKAPKSIAILQRMYLVLVGML